MQIGKYTYRKVDPYNEKDMEKYLNMHNSLDSFLNSRANPLTEEQIKWLRIRMGATKLLPYDDEESLLYKKGLERMADEHCFVCEFDNEVIGYSFICTYHIVNGKRPNDSIGIISEIYVKDGYRSGDIAYNLLQLAIDTLLKAGKTSAMMSVQEDNPNRFLHFALADKLLNKEECKRKDGRITTSYDLLISDINKIKEMSSRQLAEKAIKIKRSLLKNNILK